MESRESVEFVNYYLEEFSISKSLKVVFFKVLKVFRICKIQFLVNFIFKITKYNVTNNTLYLDHFS